MNDDYLRRSRDDDFERSSGEPRWWVMAAQGLADSAAILRTEYERQWPGAGTPSLIGSAAEIRLFYVHRSALLLYGLAIENVLKALRLIRLKAKNQPHVGPTRSKGLQIRLGGHDLTELAAAADIVLTYDETSLLRDLSELVVWSGRYPLPRHSVDYAPVVDRRSKTAAAALMFDKLFGLYPLEQRGDV